MFVLLYVLEFLFALALFVFVLFVFVLLLFEFVFVLFLFVFVLLAVFDEFEVFDVFDDVFDDRCGVLDLWCYFLIKKFMIYDKDKTPKAFLDFAK